MKLVKEKILNYLIEVASDDFSLTKDIIIDEPDEDVREILFGIYCLKEDLDFARQELIEKDKYIDLYENSPDMKISVNIKTFAIVDCNHTFMKLLGYKSKKEIIDRQIFEIFSERSLDRFKTKIFPNFLKFGKIVDAELVVKGKNGAKFEVLLNASAIRDKNSNIISTNFSFIDITELKKAKKDSKLLAKLKDTQAQLIQASKLSSLGTMAAGMCHELNNPLTVVKSFTEDLIKKKMSVIERKKRLGHILKASKRMSKIINHLRSFSRESKSDSLKTFSIRAAIDDSQVFLEQQLRSEGISLQIVCSDELKIYADKNQIESVFQNLIINSKDSFRTVNDGRDKTINIDCLLNNDKITVYYEDNAAGMTQKVQNHLFEPFFTTKEDGFGTGLGMSISHGIIEQHKGKIILESALGKGSRFIITFPAAKDKQVLANLLNIDNKQKKSTFIKKPKVLVIDDESDICFVLQCLIGDEFDVVTVSDPREAIYMIENNEFDLVITDIRMPFITGVEIVAKVKEFHPYVPVVVISGHLEKDKAVGSAFAKGAVEMIQKPFPESDEIKATLRSYLKKSRLQ